MIINTGLLAFASRRDGNQHKAAGISWHVSTANPVPVRTSCEKVDLQIQRQGSKQEDCVLVLTPSLALREMLSKTFTFPCAVVQTNSGAEPVVLRKLILRWWFRNAALIVWGGLLLMISYSRHANNAGNSSHPSCVSEITCMSSSPA